MLWGREDLLSFSVALILTNQTRWNVVSFSEEENFEGLIQAIDKLHPGVVFIYQEDRSSVSILPMKLIQDYPGLKVITFCLQDNLLEVYSKQNIIVESASDLISVIETDTVKSTAQSRWKWAKSFDI